MRGSVVRRVFGIRDEYSVQNMANIRIRFIFDSSNTLVNRLGPTKYNSPLNTPGAFGGGGFRGSQIKKSLGKLSNGWTDWHTCADSPGNGYTPNKLPLETQGGTWGVLGGQTLKVWGSYQAAGLVSTNFGSRLRIHLGMDIG